MSKLVASVHVPFIKLSWLVAAMSAYVDFAVSWSIPVIGARERKSAIYILAAGFECTFQLICCSLSIILGVAYEWPGNSSLELLVMGCDLFL